MTDATLLVRGKAVAMVGALATASFQAVTGQPSPEYMLVSRIAQWLLSAGIFVAAIQMILYFGAQREAAKHSRAREAKLEKTIEEAGNKFERFVEKVETNFLTQARAIAKLETTSDHHERRLGDIDRRHGHGRRESNHHDED